MELRDVIRQTAERIADYRASVGDGSVAAVVEEVAGGWLKQVLGLPREHRSAW